eukprot:m.97342 g.97342  ORF g.97342 m.97342 type:complete len:108 (+) comp16696_c0_seq2:82-405(+)
MAEDEQMNEEEAEPFTIDEEAEAVRVPFASIAVTSSTGIWGPCGPCAEQFKDMPYQPFAKSDRLGKAADITGTAYRGRNSGFFRKTSPSTFPLPVRKDIVGFISGSN